MNIERLESLIIQNLEISKQLMFLIQEEKRRINKTPNILDQLTPKEEKEEKEEKPKKERKPRTKKSDKKTITIVDDSNDEPLTVIV